MQDVSIYKQEIAMVYRELNGKATLVPLTIDSTDSGQQMFEKIRDKQREMSTLHSRWSWLSLLLARHEVASAEIGWILSGTAEHINGGTRVALENRKTDNLLTEALHNPRLLANEPAFILKHDRLSLQRKDEIHGLAGQQVLLIDTVGDKGKMAWLLLLFLVLSPALGIIVGKLSKRADVGVGVGAGIFALASFLQGLAAWLHG